MLRVGLFIIKLYANLFYIKCQNAGSIAENSINTEKYHHKRHTTIFNNEIEKEREKDMTFYHCHRFFVWCVCSSTRKGKQPDHISVQMRMWFGVRVLKKSEREKEEINGSWRFLLAYCSRWTLLICCEIFRNFKRYFQKTCHEIHP